MEATARPALLIFPPPRDRRRRGYDERSEGEKHLSHSNGRGSQGDCGVRRGRGGLWTLWEKIGRGKRGYANVTLGAGKKKPGGLEGGSEAKHEALRERAKSASNRARGTTLLD